MYFKRTVISSAFFAILIAGSSCSLFEQKPAKGTFFPHNRHVDGEKKACLDCHKGLDTSENTENRMRPGREACKDCHDAGFLAKVKDFPSDLVLKFNHQLHVKKQEIACLDCHGGVKTDDFKESRAAFPPMKKCGECHSEWVVDAGTPNAQRNKCLVCHKTADSMKPRNHYANWQESHKVYAAGKWDDDCRGCHAAKTGCTDCHAGGFFRPASHDLTYVQTHKFSVRNQVQNCKSCHTDDSCRDCHQTRGVSGSPGYEKKSGANPHPPGWTTDVPNSGNHHSRSARFKLDSCKACHSANDCRSCHVSRYPFRR